MNRPERRNVTSLVGKGVCGGLNIIKRLSEVKEEEVGLRLRRGKGGLVSLIACTTSMLDLIKDLSTKTSS